jgi:Flagellar biosynthesis protein, FliO
MNRRTKERGLEQAVRPGCEPGVILAACAPKSKCKDTTKGGAIKRKPAIRGQSIRAKAADAAKLGKKSKSTKKTMLRIKSTDQRGLLKTRAAGKKNAPGTRTVIVGAAIHSIEGKPPERALLQAVNEPAAFETRPDSSSNTSSKMACALQTVVLDHNLVETQLGALKSEPEGNLTEIRQSRGLRWETVLCWLTGAWKFARRQLASRQSRKRLRVCESVSLGEKRFVAVIEVDGEQFLVGGASSSVATLARLEPTQEFSEVLKRRWAQDPVQV